MVKQIFMPDKEQTNRLIDSAWWNFCQMARKAGLDVGDEYMNGRIKDIFVAGYSFGHNDTLNIIRDQLNTEYIINRLMKG